MSITIFADVPMGLDPGPSACKADVITTTLRNHIVPTDV